MVIPLADYCPGLMLLAVVRCRSLQVPQIAISLYFPFSVAFVGLNWIGIEISGR